MATAMWIGAVGFLLGGCAQASKEAVWHNRMLVKGLSEDRSMTESYAEHLHRMNATVDHDARALIDDLDLVLLRDRPTRLSRWHTP